MSIPIEYNGFKLMVMVDKLVLDNAGSRWRGRFGFWRDDAQPRLCTVSRLEINPLDAQSKTLRIAKSIIDAEMVREQSMRHTQTKYVEMQSSL